MVPGPSDTRLTVGESGASELTTFAAPALSRWRATSTGGCGLIVSPTPRYRRVDSAMRLNTGAETVPPKYRFGPCGASMTTTIATAGLRDGTKPTNDALYS